MLLVHQKVLKQTGDKNKQNVSKENFFKKIFSKSFKQGSGKRTNLENFPNK
jgi:hypothetical protein